jgi:MscS family membrane protein
MTPWCELRVWHRRLWAYLLVLLLAAAMAPGASGQESDEPLSLNPLRPVDTSSPRDTLRSFLMITEEAIRKWRGGAPLSVTFPLMRGAAETMDFSSTEYGASWDSQIKRILMLKEILDRIELPPFDQIPDKEEVAASEIAQWTIPNTRIAIARETAGRQAGEFLFSATTVEWLDISYRRAKALPYKPGATGILEEYLLAGSLLAMRQDVVVLRLHGLDLSSPLTTLEGFLDSVNEAYRITTEAEAALKASPPEMTQEEAQEAERQADDLLRRAGSAFDLSRVPAVERDDVAVEAALMLKEVFDRLVLPPVDSMPDRGTVSVAVANNVSYRWRLVGTEIDIERILEGERHGDFLFDADTVDRIADIYKRLRDLPYRAEDTAQVTSESEHRSVATSPGFYDAYISTPGHLVPSASALGRLVDGLPDGLKKSVAGQTLWQWIGLMTSVLAALLASYLVFRVIGAASKGVREPWSHWLTIVSPAAAALFVQIATDFADEYIRLTGGVLVVVRDLGQVTVLFLIAWVVWRVFAAVAETIVALQNILLRSIDASLIRIVVGLLGIIVAIGIVVEGLRGLGMDILPLVAGLGVGGLAVALAIRPTLENLIGGIILLIDKPVRVGDYCSFGSMNGTVESIGGRSTQIRCRDRRLISIPNAKFADMEIINWAQCDRILIKAMIGLRFETTQDQLRYVLVKIREMLHAHPMIDRETVRVRYAGPGASSRDLNIEIYALTHDWNEFYTIREDVFLRIEDIIEEAGTGFALAEPLSAEPELDEKERTKQQMEPERR